MSIEIMKLHYKFQKYLLGPYKITFPANLYIEYIKE